MTFEYVEFLKWSPNRSDKGSYEDNVRVMSNMIDTRLEYQKFQNETIIELFKNILLGFQIAQYESDCNTLLYVQEIK